MLADFLGQAGRLDDAIAYYRALVEVAPSDARPLFGLAELLRRRNDIPGAIETLRKAYELSGDALGVKALAGARTEEDYAGAELAVTRARLENLDLLALERYISPLDFAALYAQLGDRERAFAQLDAAVAERSPLLILLKVAPVWDSIRDDPRFAAIVRRVGIP
jgi:tetratricopeptide (TPR) repeat protein